MLHPELSEATDRVAWTLTLPDFAYALPRYAFVVRDNPDAVLHVWGQQAARWYDHRFFIERDGRLTFDAS